MWESFFYVYLNNRNQIFSADCRHTNSGTIAANLWKLVSHIILIVSGAVATIRIYCFWFTDFIYLCLQRSVESTQFTLAVTESTWRAIEVVMGLVGCMGISNISSYSKYGKYKELIDTYLHLLSNTMNNEFLFSCYCHLAALLTISQFESGHSDNNHSRKYSFAVDYLKLFIVTCELMMVRSIK